jgi:hypothetical protein
MKRNEIKKHYTKTKRYKTKNNLHGRETKQNETVCLRNGMERYETEK